MLRARQKIIPIASGLRGSDVELLDERRGGMTQREADTLRFRLRCIDAGLGTGDVALITVPERQIDGGGGEGLSTGGDVRVLSNQFAVPLLAGAKGKVGNDFAAGAAQLRLG